MGLSREELLDIAKSITPKGINIVDITHVKDQIFSITLKSNFGFGPSSSIFLNPNYVRLSVGEKKDILAETREKAKSEIDKKIKNFVEDYYDLAEKNLESQEYLRRRYGETDIIYSVPRYRTISRAPHAIERYDLDYYYSIAASNNIPCYKPLWEVLARGSFRHRHREELFEYMHGALERYKQALFAVDIIRRLLQTGIGTGNDIVFLVIFHFYYFITVMKALGDNLAWILNYFYHLDLESDPKQIDLTRTNFKAKLSCRNNQLFKEICQGPGYEKYVDLVKFRDVVVHRHALHVLRAQIGMNGPMKIMVPIDPTTGVMIPGLGRPRSKRKSVTRADAESIAKYGLKEMLIALVPEKDLEYKAVDKFCQDHLEFISHSYSQALKHFLSESKAYGRP